MKFLAGLAVLVALVCGLTVVSLAKSFKSQGAKITPVSPGTQEGVESSVPYSKTSQTKTGVTISESTTKTQVEIGE
ncbi:MAG TPA: hypothetical protein VJB99_02325 [Patescibacteria group bacterium]|nr:hypothetical protein [Patescibacteria group bacterium]